MQSTDIRFVPGTLKEAPTWIKSVSGVGRAVVVTSRAVGERHAPDVLNALASGPVPVHVLWVPDGERAKSISTVRRCYKSLLDLGFGRTDVIVSLGGGSVSDLAGFLASTWHRGTNLVHLPTTLLAQVDACVGGKTAINLGEARNAVGSFYEPSLVLIDSHILRTLGSRDVASGMAEILKCGLVADAEILESVRKVAELNISSRVDSLETCIRSSLAVKMNLVSQDARDRSSRMLLNYGHTIGQAIESASRFRRYRHGEAVGLGMLVAARAGEMLGVSSRELSSLTREMLLAWGLPCKVESLSFDDIGARLHLDKKSLDGRPAFVLVERPGSARIVPMPKLSILREAFKEIE